MINKMCSDIAAGRLVYWDPVNCNHGSGLFAIAEGILCRAHNTDGCRFCRETCEDYEVPEGYFKRK